MDGKEGWGFVAALEPRFAPLVTRLELQAQRRPALFRWRVFAAGVLGYLILGGVIGVITATVALPFAFAVAAVVNADIGLVVIVGLMLIGTMLWRTFRLAPSKLPGVRITRSQAPVLFAAVERIGQAMRAPPIHEMRICDGVNAHSAQLRRYGILPYNVLMIGLPLFHALPADELESQIAHELGHFALRHGHFVYGVRMRWRQVGKRLNTGLTAKLLRRFFAWYGPWFLAHGQVLLRRREFEADAAAAQVVGAQLLATSHRRTAYKFLRYGFLSLAAAEEAARFGDLGLIDWPEVLRQLALPDARDAAALARLLARPARLVDSHPPLRDRLTALGDDFALESPPATAAAGSLLGISAGHLLAELLARNAWFVRLAKQVV